MTGIHSRTREAVECPCAGCRGPNGGGLRRWEPGGGHGPRRGSLAWGRGVGRPARRRGDRTGDAVSGGAEASESAGGPGCSDRRSHHPHRMGRRVVRVIVEGTDAHDGHQTLVTALVTGTGRALSVTIDTVAKVDLTGRQHAIEAALVQRARQLLPAEGLAIVAADVGFCPADCLAAVGVVGWRYVIRRPAIAGSTPRAAPGSCRIDRIGACARAAGVPQPSPKVASRPGWWPLARKGQRIRGSGDELATVRDLSGDSRGCSPASD